MRKILIVEDDEKLLRELGTFLTNNGYQAESLPEGEYTAAAILEAGPDLILLDLGLPGTSQDFGASGDCDHQPGYADGGAYEHEPGGG